MKIYDTSKNQVKVDVICMIGDLIEKAEEFRTSYFWTPPANANGRRSYERRNSVQPFAWEEGGHVYSAEFRVDCSCKNVYARGEYTRDGKRTTLTAIKNSRTRMIDSL